MYEVDVAVVSCVELTIEGIAVEVFAVGRLFIKRVACLWFVPTANLLVQMRSIDLFFL